MCIVAPFFQCIFRRCDTCRLLTRFSEDPDILKDMVHLQEDLGGNGEEVEPLACVRSSIWGMLYADDAGSVSTSAEGLAKMMTVTATIFEAAGLAGTENKTKTMLLRTLNQVAPTSPIGIEPAGQRYLQTMQFLYLGGIIDANTDIMPLIKPWIRLGWAYYDCFKREPYDMEDAPFM